MQTFWNYVCKNCRLWMNRINIFAQINSNSFKGIKISIFSLSCNMSFNLYTRTLKIKIESLLVDKWKFFILIVMPSLKHVYLKSPIKIDDKVVKQYSCLAWSKKISLLWECYSRLLFFNVLHAKCVFTLFFAKIFFMHFVTRSISVHNTFNKQIYCWTELYPK